MASGKGSWSTTASDNDDADSNINWMEGQAPSTVNGSARAMMAADAVDLRDGGFINLQEYTFAYVSTNQGTIATDVTANNLYGAGRRARAVGSNTGTIFGTIISSAYSAPNTTLTFAWDTASNLANESIALSISKQSAKAQPGYVKVTSYTSGSGTHTVDSGCKRLRVRLIGGGGGGQGRGSGAGAGGNGGDTTFGALTGGGGVGGSGTTPGTGGTATGGSVANIPGGAGGGGAGSSASLDGVGGQGGSGPFGGGGRGRYSGSGAAGATNSGAGGGGGASSTASPEVGGPGGGSGGYVEHIYNSLASTYSYSVGAAGAAGAGATAGGAGAAGVIIVEENF